MQNKNNNQKSVKNSNLTLYLLAGMVACCLMGKGAINAVDRVEQKAKWGVVNPDERKKLDRQNKAASALFVFSLFGTVACAMGVLGREMGEDFKDAQRELDAVRERMNQRSR